MMGCCGHFSALFRSKNESDLLFFHGSRLAIRAGCGGRRSAGSLLELFVEILLTSFFPMPWSKTPPRLQGQGGEKKTNGEENKGPSFEGPGLQLSHMSYSPTMRGNHSQGDAGRARRTPNTLKMQQESPLQVKGHHLHPPQDANLQPLSYLHKFGSTGWI